MRIAARRNRILAALPDAELRRWLLRLEPVQMNLGQALYEPDAAPTHAYFPTTSIVSLRYGTTTGESAEVALVGNEGVVGLPIFMGGDSTVGRAVVYCAGSGFRLEAEAVKEECRRAASVLPLLLRYTQSLILQMAQTAICNRHHSLDQQLCRRLLLCLDRIDGNELATTHVQIAGSLGVRRGGITQCALRLQSLGLIRYARGRIAVLDRAALEKRSCECYAVVRQEYERLLPACDG